jgi:S1-C subfamily serine protease
VVQIRARGPGLDPQGATLGTGFIASASGHVVTAKHVVDAVDFAAGQVLHVAFAGPEVDTPELKMRASFVGTDGTVIDTAAELDLALVEVPDANSLTFRVELGPRVIEAAPRPIQASATNLREGTEVAVSGYPLNEPSLVTNAGILATSFSPVDVDGTFHDRYLGDFTANPGNSGGPVYAVANAMVVGVCVAGKLAPVVGGVGAHAAGLTVIVPIAEAIVLMERNGLAAPKPTTAPPRPSGRRRKKNRRR